MSSIDTKKGLLMGRPFGGIPILWRKSISQISKFITFDDDRMLGIIINIENYRILILNVYLPYQSDENYSSYLEYLGKIEAKL